MKKDEENRRVRLLHFLLIGGGSFALLALFSVRVGAGSSPNSHLPTVQVAVLDTPIDASHPSLGSLVSQGWVKEVPLMDEAERKEQAWYQVNQDSFERFRKALDQGLYREDVSFLDSLSLLSSGNHSYWDHTEVMKNLLKVVKGAMKYFFSPTYRRKLQEVAYYLHGQHVAGLIIKAHRVLGISSGPSESIDLIAYPLVALNDKIMTPSSRMALNKKTGIGISSGDLEFSPEQMRENLRCHFRSISRVLKEKKVRIVNLSLEGPEASSFGLSFDGKSLFQQLFHGQDGKVFSEEKSKVWTEELGAFIQENSQSVFVLAAGNGGRSLDLMKIHPGLLEAPNLIKVGAVGVDGKWSRFSNYSPSHVNIAAPGEGIASDFVGGGKIHMSGISQAVALVTNALIQVVSQNPGLNPSGAIDVLYHHYTRMDSSLSLKVEGGRVLTTLNDRVVSLEELKDRDQALKDLLKAFKEKPFEKETCSGIF